jgi:seryl-tRNA synthetase
MLDITVFRNNPDAVRTALRNRNADASIVDRVIEADERRRKLLAEMERLKHEKNKASESIPKLKKEGKDVSAIVTEMREVGDRIKALEGEVETAETALSDLVRTIPNAPHESVPVGKSADENKVVRAWGEGKVQPPDYQPAPFAFPAKAHWDLATDLGIVDFERAVKIAGSRFVLMSGLGARLERALMNFMLDLHTGEHGYREMLPPFIANSTTLYGTGQLPKFKEDLFKLENTDYYLIPTSEVPLTNLHRDEILEAEQLPLYYTGYSACFRSEAGAAGKDTRGLIRVHQFEKVELIKFSHPDTSFDELEGMVRNAERVLQLLEIPHRIVLLCTGDMGFSSAKTYDLEVWAPGQNRWVEISSCSNCTDFQARRASIKYRPQPKAKPEFLHTLNGSGLAIGRTVMAVMETFQQADGSIRIPAALRGYMGGVDVIEKNSTPAPAAV